MAGKRLIYVCTLIGCGMFYIAYQEWASWILLLAVAGLPWLSLLISLPGILSFRLKPECPTALPMGTEGAVTLVGISRFAVPPFRSRVRVTRCTTGEQWQYRKDRALPTEHCGGLTITPEKVRVCDYLGLFRFPKRKAETVTVLVRPKMVEMEAPPDLERYLAKAWRPKPGGGYAENHELRLYRPGDNLNQVHWKLTAKTGKLTIREPMEPERGLVLLTMDLMGSPEKLDEKFGKLLWMGHYLLNKNIAHEVHVLTAKGMECWSVRTEVDLNKCIDQLLCCAPAAEGSIQAQSISASWQFHIGGERHEA